MTNAAKKHHHGGLGVEEALKIIIRSEHQIDRNAGPARPKAIPDKLAILITLNKYAARWPGLRKDNGSSRRLEVRASCLIPPASVLAFRLTEDTIAAFERFNLEQIALDGAHALVKLLR